MLRMFAILLVLSLTAGAAAFFVRAAFPDAWRRFAKRTFVAAWAAGAASVLAWRAGRELDLDGVARAGATVGGAVLASAAALFVTSVLWAPAGALLRRRPPVDPKRRAFLQGVVGGVPIAAAATGPGAAVAGSLAPVVKRVEAKSATIPRALDGLKILQLTDVHLGAFIDVEHVRRAVEAARPFAPDMIVFTGDVADDYELLPPALDVVNSLAPRLGAYACIGNHEIYRGRAAAERIFAEKGVRMLCSDGVVVEADGAKLWLCGADDPARLGQEHRPFLDDTIGKALAGCPDDVTCRIVLSHRPEGFEAAARRGATLTLSGHTHGAQMALFGRSLLEMFAPKSYLLGTYRKGDSLLYTSAGLGHWFPFRLNCPCEAALITLRAA